MENVFGSPSSYFSGLILVPEETVLETVATGVLPTAVQRACRLERRRIKARVNVSFVIVPSFVNVTFLNVWGTIISPRTYSPLSILLYKKNKLIGMVILINVQYHIFLNRNSCFGNAYVHNLLAQESTKKYKNVVFFLFFAI